MKKIKFFLLMLFASTMIVNLQAANTTEEDAANYQASLMSYIKTEGYTPKIDSDGDINFKHDGDNYWVTVSPYDDGYYVTVMTVTNVEGRNINKVRKAMDETARGLKYVRLYTNSSESAVTTSYSWYCFSIVDFKRMFENALDVVSTADSRFIKRFLELDN